MNSFLWSSAIYLRSCIFLLISSSLWVLVDSSILSSWASSRHWFLKSSEEQSFRLAFEMNCSISFRAFRQFWLRVPLRDSSFSISRSRNLVSRSPLILTAVMVCSTAAAWRSNSLVRAQTDSLNWSLTLWICFLQTVARMLSNLGTRTLALTVSSSSARQGAISVGTSILWLIFFSWMCVESLPASCSKLCLNSGRSSLAKLMGSSSEGRTKVAQFLSLKSSLMVLRMRFLLLMVWEAPFCSSSALSKYSLAVTSTPSLFSSLRLKSLRIMNRLGSSTELLGLVSDFSIIFPSQMKMLRFWRAGSSMGPTLLQRTVVESSRETANSLDSQFSELLSLPSPSTSRKRRMLSQSSSTQSCKMWIPLVPPPRLPQTGKHSSRGRMPCVRLWTRWFMSADLPVFVLPTMLRMWQFLGGSFAMKPRPSGWSSSPFFDSQTKGMAFLSVSVGFSRWCMGLIIIYINSLIADFQAIDKQPCHHDCRRKMSRIQSSILQRWSSAKFSRFQSPALTVLLWVMTSSIFFSNSVESMSPATLRHCGVRSSPFMASIFSSSFSSEALDLASQPVSRCSFCFMYSLIHFSLSLKEASTTRQMRSWIALNSPLSSRNMRALNTSILLLIDSISPSIFNDRVYKQCADSTLALSKLEPQETSPAQSLFSDRSALRAPSL